MLLKIFSNIFKQDKHMKLIVGLGNPGEKYLQTRHNAGFILLNELRKAWQFPEFQMQKKFNAFVSEGNIEGQKVILAKPQTFMNNSGESVRKILAFYKLTPAQLIVIHDDLDIESGILRVSFDSSAGGHNGISDIIEKLGTQKFKRLRIGIEGSEKRKERQMPGDKFVLQNFSPLELEAVQNLAKDAMAEISQN